MSILTKVTASLVEYRQKLNTLMFRNLSDKLEEYVSVDDFGAKGDGVTDDTVAIRNAVNSGYKLISFTAGKTYVVKDGFTLPAGVTITGYGATINYIKPTFSYNHCITIGFGNNMIRGLSIKCDSAYVRGDTGFAISLYECTNVRVFDCNFNDIASAAIWHTRTSRTIISNCMIFNGKADGIHVSDGCRDFNVSKNIVQGCHDDHIAIVSDIPDDGSVPFAGIVQGNITSDGVAGHGILLIGCKDVIVDANVIRGMKGAGIGSYFWNTTGTPAAENWVERCTITNNIINSCGLDPILADNATSFLIGALKDSVVRGNVINGAYSSKFDTLNVPANCMIIASALNVEISGNTFRASAGHAIMTRPGLVAGAPTFDDLYITGNTFDHIAKDAVHIVPASGIFLGNVVCSHNTLIKTPYASGWTSSMTIQQCASLTFSGNDNQSSAYGYTLTSITTMDVYSNKPAVVQTYTPFVSGTNGTPTFGTISGSFWREGDTVHGTVNIPITATNGSTGISFTLPLPAKYSGSVRAFGRENNPSGKMLYGIMDNNTTMHIIRYDNTDPLFSQTTGNITMSFTYMKA